MIALMHEAIGDYDSVKKIIWGVLDIVDRYKNKFRNAIVSRPYNKNDYPHIRYQSYTLNEYSTEWGHPQFDTWGMFLMLISALKIKGFDVCRNESDHRLIELVVWFLISIRYWETPDYGVFEEGPEIHSSSLGFCVAGLRDIQETFQIPISNDFIAWGESALQRLLPRESTSRACCMSQILLIYPCNVLNKEQTSNVLDNAEHNLIRKYGYGLVRYPGDLYYSANQNNPHGNEATWPLGFLFLSLAYFKLASESETKESKRYYEKGNSYLKKTEELMIDGKVPELYTDTAEKPNENENIPLAWAQAFYILALRKRDEFLEQKAVQCLI